MMEKIELNNYRCYEHLELSFKKKTNVLIGDNSSGKTTILRALRSVLSSFFMGYSDENTRFIGLSKSDFTILINDNHIVTEMPINVHFELLGKTADLVLNSAKSRTLQKPLDNITKYGQELKKTLFNTDRQQVNPLPLFASFSAGYLHSSRNLSGKRFKEYLHKPTFGYYECMLGDGFFQYWTKRLLILREGKKGEHELSCVRKAIQLGLGGEGCNIIRDMEIRLYQGKVYYIFMDGREVDSDNLSDGYARLVNIVTDLAFRCALLNQGIYGEEACLKTNGTVLIDEIDLHLHPSLQSLVLKGLQHAFPNLQFIVTTHAPMVMTGIPINEESIIYKLNYTPEDGYTAQLMDLYGLDASTIIKLALNTVPRSKEVEDRLKTLFSFIDTNQYENASGYLKNMQEEFKDNLPELFKAEAMLNFLKDEDDQDR